MSILPIFFIYGLAFFSMGLAMLMESSHSSFLAEGRALRWLAAFGIIHGTHEWLEMVIVLQNWIPFSLPPILGWIRLILLVTSFGCLILFGWQVIQPQNGYSFRKNITAALLWLVAFVLLVILGVLLKGPSVAHWASYPDALSRYTLAIPGAALAALALDRLAREASRTDRRNIASSLWAAAVGFGLYSLSQLFVTPTDIFPATVLNNAAFLNWTGVPIQAVRAILAVLITISMIRASQLSEQERQVQLLAAQQARLEALEQVQRELVEREGMRKELLRHTVIAQEDERARIARELHDETAQFLTALNLNLATLESRLPQTQAIRELSDRLADLSRRMSQGIYRMVHDLRPAQLDDLGLVAALQYLADEARQRSGLEVSLTVEGDSRRLDPLIETVLFRVAQEALSNVARHSHAAKASLRLCFDLGQVELDVQDNGIGFDPQLEQEPPKGWGLAGMRERSDSVDGCLQIHSEPGRGTRVEISVPLKDIEGETPHGDDPLTVGR